MTQYVHLLTSSAIAMPTDLWVPVTKDLHPMLARQFSVGAYYTGIRGWEFSVEGYYKAMKNLWKRTQLRNRIHGRKEKRPYQRMD